MGYSNYHLLSTSKMEARIFSMAHRLIARLVLGSSRSAAPTTSSSHRHLSAERARPAGSVCARKRGRAMGSKLKRLGRVMVREA